MARRYSSVVRRYESAKIESWSQRRDERVEAARHLADHLVDTVDRAAAALVLAGGGVGALQRRQDRRPAQERRVGGTGLAGPQGQHQRRDGQQQRQDQGQAGTRTGFGHGEQAPDGLLDRVLARRRRTGRLLLRESHRQLRGCLDRECVYSRLPKRPARLDGARQRFGFSLTARRIDGPPRAVAELPENFASVMVKGTL